MISAPKVTIKLNGSAPIFNAGHLARCMELVPASMLQGGVLRWIHYEIQLKLSSGPDKLILPLSSAHALANFVNRTQSEYGYMAAHHIAELIETAESKHKWKLAAQRANSRL